MVSNRISTVAWTKETLLRRKENHEKIVKSMENASLRFINERPSEEADPINIIVMDGGGMYGYAQVALIDEMQKIAGKEDFLQFFDLAGGTSVGGVGALIMGEQGSNKNFVEDATDILDRIREGSFKKMRLGNLFTDGTLMSDEDKMGNIFKAKYGGKPLYKSDGLKSFALCTIRNNSNEDSNNTSDESKFKPFVLRSYDVFDDSYEDIEDTEGNDDMDDFKMDGTNDIDLWEAMTATSAVPVLVDRIELNVNGEKRKAADGVLVSNGPLAIAMSEAHRLWPKRPIGVVLSTGGSDSEMPYITRAIDIAKKTHSPNLHFLRLTMSLHGKFSPAETDERKIQEMEKATRDFAQEHVEEISVLIKKLKASGSRRPSVPRNLTHQKSNRLHRFSRWGTGHSTSNSQPRSSIFGQLRPSIFGTSSSGSKRRSHRDSTDSSIVEEVLSHLEEIDFDNTAHSDTPLDLHRRRSSISQVDEKVARKGLFSGPCLFC